VLHRTAIPLRYIAAGESRRSGRNMNYKRAFASLLCALLFMAGSFAAGGMIADLSGDHPPSLASSALTGVAFWPAMLLERLVPRTPRRFDLPAVWFSVLFLLPVLYATCFYAVSTWTMQILRRKNAGPQLAGDAGPANRRL
jgi:hypothetical protein